MCKAEYFCKVSGALHFEFVYEMGFQNINSRLPATPECNAAGSRKHKKPF